MSERYDGFNKLASTLTSEIERRIPSDLIVDFGEIGSDGTLITVSTNLKIPESEYYVCDWVKTEVYCSRNDGPCSDGLGICNCPGIQVREKSIRNKQVVVAWINSTPIVVGTFSKKGVFHGSTFRKG